MKEFKIRKELLNDEELRTNRISYKRLIDAYIGDKLLCNNISEIDELIYDNVVVGELFECCYDEDHYNNDSELQDEYDSYKELVNSHDYDEMLDIYQFCLCDLTQWDIENINELQEHFNSNDVIIAYSEVLNLYILMVPHCGTSWDYVMTDIKPTIIG